MNDLYPHYFERYLNVKYVSLLRKMEKDLNETLSKDKEAKKYIKKIKVEFQVKCYLKDAKSKD